MERRMMCSGGAAGGVPHVAGPGAGPVAGVGALLFQAGEGRSWPRIGGPGAVSGLDAGKVTAFMVDYCAGPQHVVGEGDGDVAAGVPAVRARDRADGRPAGGGGSRRSRRGGCRRCPAACRRRRSSGCWPAATGTRRSGLRDYAVLSLLARLGLRGAEAAGLQLGDIDWRAGEIAVTGKGSRTERLPLPAAAGEALAAWLTDGRPRCESRAVFVTVRRPYRPLTPEAVRAVMGRACDRAGLERRGAHRLRHALATEMLRAGASLPEVGQVLRHRSHAVHRRSMPRSTRTRCARWRGRGREPGSERAAGQGRGVPGHAPGAGVQADHPGPAPDELRPLLRGPRRRPRDQRTWRWSGRPRPRGAAATRPTRPGGSTSCGSSPATCRRWTRPPRSRPRTCWRAVSGGSRPTSTPRQEIAALMSAAGRSGPRCGRRPGGR